mmetsp:Transcript_35828/g.82244  ORF Transcript_35828/g.82244 Transcript_35828/m.82244 type:complete len:337 (-) Transcript_35828:1391-2401(-)
MSVCMVRSLSNSLPCSARSSWTCDLSLWSSACASATCTCKSFMSSDRRCTSAAICPTSCTSCSNLSRSPSCCCFSASNLETSAAKILCFSSKTSRSCSKHLRSEETIASVSRTLLAAFWRAFSTCKWKAFKRSLSLRTCLSCSSSSSRLALSSASTCKRSCVKVRRSSSSCAQACLVCSLLFLSASRMLRCSSSSLACSACKRSRSRTFVCWLSLWLSSMCRFISVTRSHCSSTSLTCFATCASRSAMPRSRISSCRSRTDHSTDLSACFASLTCLSTLSCNSFALSSSASSRLTCSSSCSLCFRASSKRLTDLSSLSLIIFSNCCTRAILVSLAC